MKDPKIQHTKDYNKFITLDFNRDKSKKHIEEIKENIRKENLLHLHPIIVNDKWEVIDGQHRLAAAKDMDIDIFYIQENVSYDHILNSNLIQKNSKLTDVIKFYALKEQKSDYIKFRSLLISLGLQPKALIGLLFGTCSSPMITLIKSGKFRMPLDVEKTDIIINGYKKITDFCETKKIKPTSMLTSSQFCIAWRNIGLLSAYNDQIFYQKLENRWFELKPQLNSQEWTRLLINIYNWKNHNQIVYDQTY